MNPLNTSGSPLRQGQTANNRFEQRGNKNSQNYQLKTVAKSLYNGAKTRMQVSEETCVRIQNVCRYIARLRKSNQLYLVNRGICPITLQAGVEFVTTNPEVMQGGLP